MLNPLQQFQQAMKRGIPFYDMVEVQLGANAIGTKTITNQDGRDYFITDIINCSFISASNVPTSDFLYQISDSGANYQLSYQQIHAYSLGSGKVPTRLDVPYVVEPTSDMKFDFTNNSATPITVQLVVKGYKIPKSGLVDAIRNIGVPFWDMFDVTIPASQSVKGIINNKDKKTFLMQDYSAFSKNLTTGVQTLLYRFYLRDSGSKDAMAQSFISGGFVGNGEFPTRFSVPFALPTQRQLELELSSDLTSASQRVYLVVKGVKIPKSK